MATGPAGNEDKLEGKESEPQRPDPCEEIEDEDEELTDQEAEAYAAGIKYTAAAKALRVVLRTVPELRPAIKEFMEMWVTIQREQRLRTAQLAVRTTGLFLMGLALSFLFLGWVIHELKGQRDVLLSVLSPLVSLLSFAGGGWLFGQRNRR